MKHYLDIDTIKRQLNIEECYDHDDFYLMGLRDAAVETVQKYIDYPLSQLEDENGQLPPSLNHAILLLISTWYAIRESVSSTSMLPVPHAFDLLIDLWRDYKICKNE